MSIEDFTQEVISNNKDIFTRIVYELELAKQEILIATSWFTDEVLYSILLRKADEGLRIEILMADNQENERLDFAALESKGALVMKVKNVGYGIMHQKFCVIDQRLTMLGSYNWSNNAKNNNHESIIVTTHPDSVKSLLDTFRDIRDRARGIIDTPPVAPIVQVPQVKKELMVNKVLKIKQEYEEVLDDLIAAETAAFDETAMQGEGYEKAKANNGSPMVIVQSMDIIYARFIDDIDVTEDQKAHMLAKIQDQGMKFADRLKKCSEEEIEAIERELQTKEHELNNDKIRLESVLELGDREIKSIKEDKVPFINEKIDALLEKIKVAQLDFIRPKFKWHELLPSIIFTAVLLIYVHMFYSSAAYILLYVEKDAAQAHADHVHNYIPPQVFYPEAYSSAAKKGGIGLPFILIVPFLLLGLANASKWVESGLFKKGWAFILFIFFIDGFLAYTVSHTIYMAKLLTGADGIKDAWVFWMAFTESNFYLVFIFGALGLYVFKVAYDKLIKAFEERSPNLEAQRNDLSIMQFKEDIEINKAAMAAYQQEIKTVDDRLISQRAELRIVNNDLNILPGQFEPKVAANRSALIEDQKSIQTVTDRYLAYVETNKVPVSKRALLSRIGQFLSGWNHYLNDEYSVQRADGTYAEVLKMVEDWKGRKFTNGTYDQRITE